MNKEIGMASVREIPIQNRSVAGRFYSHKNNRLLDFESQLEKKCYLTLEFDESVVSYEPQPLKIGNYVPDILAIRENEKPLLIEVKYSDEAENPDEKLKRKFDVLSAYCDKNDMEFSVFTEKRINDPYFSNISLIYNYANVNVPQEIQDKILLAVPQEGATIGNVLKTFNNNIQYLSYVYHLIFRNILTINFYSILSLDTIVRKRND